MMLNGIRIKSYVVEDSIRQPSYIPSSLKDGSHNFQEIYAIGQKYCLRFQYSLWSITIPRNHHIS
ncbi:hypothetical protein BH18THE2_BH18THE2_07650 [soil metagenome]